MPFFSIIIPTYNRAELIGRTLESVVLQDYIDWECIVVDDGGQDDTKAVVEHFGNDRIKYHWIEHGERSRARNYGVDQSIGEYIVFLDSDDTLLPSYLSTMSTQIQEGVEVKVLRCGFHFIRDGLEIDRSCTYYGSSVQRVWHCYSPVLSFCCARDVLDKILWPEDINIWEDQYFFLQVAMSFNVTEVPQKLCTVYDHVDRSVNLNTRKQIISRVEQHEYAVSRFFRNFGEQITGEIDWMDATDLLMDRYRAAAYDAIKSQQLSLARSIMWRAWKYVRLHNFPRFVYTGIRTIIGR